MPVLAKIGAWKTGQGRCGWSGRVCEEAALGGLSSRSPTEGQPRALQGGRGTEVGGQLSEG